MDDEDYMRGIAAYWIAAATVAESEINSIEEHFGKAALQKDIDSIRTNSYLNKIGISHDGKRIQRNV